MLSSLVFGLEPGFASPGCPESLLWYPRIALEAHSYTSDIEERKLFSLFVKHIEFACKSPEMKSKAAAAQ